MKKANLVLKSCYLPNPGTVNNTGAVNADRTVMRWKNINMRDLLGDMYDHHDLFNLKLDSVAFDNKDGQVDVDGNYIYLFPENEVDRVVSIEMDGFSFVNNTYDTSQGANTSTAVLGLYEFNYNVIISNYNDNGFVTFNKGTNMHDLTISYKTVRDGLLPTVKPGAHYPQMVFKFSIFGIERERKPQRLIDMSM